MLKAATDGHEQTSVLGEEDQPFDQVNTRPDIDQLLRSLGPVGEREFGHNGRPILKLCER